MVSIKKLSLVSQYPQEHGQKLNRKFAYALMPEATIDTDNAANTKQI